MENNPLVPILREAQNSAFTVQGLEMAQKINSNAAELKGLEQPKKLRDSKFHEAWNAMAETLLKLAGGEIERIQAGIKADKGKQAEKDKRTLHARVAEAGLARTRFEGMSEEALDRELGELTSKPFITTAPEIVDTLLSVARARGVEGVDAHFEVLTGKDYRSTWLQSPESRHALAEIAAYSEMEKEMAKGNFSFPVFDKGGGITAVAFEELIDGVPK